MQVIEFSGNKGISNVNEHWIVAPGVEGSIPFHRPKYQGARVAQAL